MDFGSGALAWECADRASSEGFFTFVQNLRAQWPHEPMVLVLDNVSYHKSAMLRQWAQRQDPALQLLWLPTYSPELNLIERLWRFLKSKLACHRYWNDRAGLITLAENVLAHTTVSFAAATYPHLTMSQDL